MQVEDRWKKLGLTAGLVAPLLALLPSLVSGPLDAAVDGDPALLELRLRLTAHGENLLGPYSRFHFQHPGPALFYWMSPFYFLLGQAHGALFLGAVALNAAAVWLIHRVIRPRRWTETLGVAVLISLMLASLGAERWFSAWSGHIPALAFGAAIFTFAASAAGRTAHLPLALALATFAVQTHVGYAAPATLIALTAVLAICFPRIVGSPGPGRPLWLGLAVLPGLLWLPPLFEEFSAEGGNLSKLAGFFWLPHAGVAMSKAADILGGRLTGFLWGQWSPIVPTLSAALALALPAAYVRSMRRGDTLAASLSLLSLAGLLGGFFAVTRIVGPPEEHLVAWAPMLGLAGFSGLTLTALGGAGERRKTPARKVAAIAFASLFLVVSLANLREAWAPRRLEGWSQSSAHRGIAELASRARTALTENQIRFPEVRIATSDCWPWAAGALLRMHKLGVRFCVEESWLFQYGDGFACGGAGEESGSRPTPDGLLILGGREFQAAVRGDPRFLQVASWREGGIFLNRNPPLTREIDFTRPEAAIYVAGGFVFLDRLETAGGRWSSGPTSTVTLPLQPGVACDLEIVAQPLRVPGRVQIVEVELNGAPVTRFPMVDRELAYIIRLPAEQVLKVNRLRFRYAYSEPPMLHIEGSDDWRPVGVRFRTMRITPVP